MMNSRYEDRKTERSFFILESRFNLVFKNALRYVVCAAPLTHSGLPLRI